MTRLKEYYENLPASTSPKTNFVRELAYVCGVGEMTVRNWIAGRSKPTDERILEILEHATNIPKEQLFEHEGV